MKTTLNLGKVAYTSNAKRNAVQLDVEIKTIDSAIDYETLKEVKSVPVFSMCGGIWNGNKSDYIMCGQCIDDIAKLFPTNAKVQRLKEIWEQYHLNDLNAGTKVQCDALAQWREQNNVEGYAYTQECEYLKSIDLFEDKGIKYGHQWLYRSIPVEVINEVIKLTK